MLLLGRFTKVMPSRLLLLSIYHRVLPWAFARQTSVSKRQHHMGGVQPKLQDTTDAV